MSEASEYGPWIELDGSGPPDIPPGSWIECIYIGQGVKVPEGHSFVAATWPGFFWRWCRVRLNWFESVRRRVCEQPDYAPIIRIRIARPPASAVERLAQIVAMPPTSPIPDSDRDRRLPKRVPG